MNARVTSIASGIDGTLIDVECVLANGLPNMVIVGFANKAIDEAKERVRSAFASSRIAFPKKRITINLAPADVPKETPALDLAIAVVVMLAGEQVKLLDSNKNMIFLGELGLDGSIRPVRGIVGSLLDAKQKGVHRFMLPLANIKQAELIPNIEIIPVSSLKEAFEILSGTTETKAIKTDTLQIRGSRQKVAVDFSQVVGQDRAKRALEIAAAGAHNIMLSGPRERAKACSPSLPRDTTSVNSRRNT